MGEPARNDTEAFGQATLFEGKKFTTHRIAVQATEALSDAPLRLDQAVQIRGTGIVVKVSHDAKGHRVHTVQFTAVTVEGDSGSGDGSVINLRS